MNTHTHTQNHGDPIKITRPPKQIINYKNGEQGQTTLDSQTERRLLSLQEEYSDIFSEEHSITSVYEHKINLIEPEKFIRRIYQVPIKYQAEVQQEIQRMLEEDIIEISNSSFLNPLLLVRKKTGEIWLCLDMRNLNNLVEKEFDCAPTAEDLFIKCEGARYLTKLDLTASFWQVPLC